MKHIACCRIVFIYINVKRIISSSPVTVVVVVVVVVVIEVVVVVAVSSPSHSAGSIPLNIRKNVMYIVYKYKRHSRVICYQNL